MTNPVADTSGPLGAVTSIKVKLGLLVAASVLVASVLSTLGVGGLVYAILNASEHGWTSPATLIALPVAVAVL